MNARHVLWALPLAVALVAACEPPEDAGAPDAALHLLSPDVGSSLPDTGPRGLDADLEPPDADENEPPDTGRRRRDAGARLDADTEPEDSGTDPADGAVTPMDANGPGPADAAAMPPDASPIFGCTSAPAPVAPPSPLPAELAPLAFETADWPGLRDFPASGPGWHYVGRCPSLPVNAWNIVAYVLTELAIYCPGVPGTDPRAAILDASMLGCPGHPSGVHARYDIDLGYFTCGATNLTQPAANPGGLAITQIWLGNTLDPNVFDPRRSYWLWRRLKEAFNNSVMMQMDEENSAAIRQWARSRLGPSAPVPGEGDPPDTRPIYAHHMHIHVGITEVQAQNVNWQWFEAAARNQRIGEYAIW
ncbi:MAG: hypothetical protein HY901_31250 [Deltaproteobacteria bacterium]|nr:hypothetical protein [Deltaproteobacteria bacterium]